jgi:hypothetical protein
MTLVMNQGYSKADALRMYGEAVQTRNQMIRRYRAASRR